MRPRPKSRRSCLNSAGGHFRCLGGAAQAGLALKQAVKLSLQLQKSKKPTFSSGSDGQTRTEIV